jgi:tetratricopeptide (TPR) repeat protein
MRLAAILPTTVWLLAAAAPVAAAEDLTPQAVERFFLEVRDACFGLEPRRLSALLDAPALEARLAASGVLDGPGAPDTERTELLQLHWVLFAARHPALSAWRQLAVTGTVPLRDAGDLIEARVVARYREEDAIDIGGGDKERSARLRLELRPAAAGGGWRLVDIEDLGAAVRLSDLLRLELDRRGGDRERAARQGLLEALRAALEDDEDALEERRELLAGGLIGPDQALGNTLAPEWDGLRRLYTARLLLEKDDAARAALRELDAAPPGTAERFLALALRTRSLLAAGEPGAALAAAQRCRELFGEDGEVRTWIGDALLCLDRREEALAEYRRALELAPDATEALVGLGVSLPEGDKGELAAHFERHGCDPLQTVLLVRRFLNEEDPEAAAVVLELARTQCSDCAGEGFTGLEAEVLEKRGQHAAAARLLEELLGRADWQSNRAEILERYVRNRILAGEDAARVWSELSAADGIAALDEVVRLLQAAQDDEALEHVVELALARFPEDPGAAWWQAELLWRCGDVAGAVKLLARRRNDFVATRSLEVIEGRLVKGLVQLGRFDEALAEAQRSTARDGNPWYELLVTTRAGRGPDAAAVLERCVGPAGLDLEELLEDEDLGPALRETVLPHYLPAALARRQAELDELVAAYREHLPAELLPRPMPPAERNAYFAWVRLPENVREEPLESPDGEEEDEERVDPRRAALEDVLWGDAPFPDGELGELLEAWMRELEPLQGILDEGIARGEYEAPPDVGESEVSLPRSPVGAIRVLTTARRLRVKQLAASSRLDEACAGAVKLLELARLFASSPGGIEAMLGSFHAVLAVRQALWLSGQAPGAAEVQRRFIAALASLPVGVHRELLLSESCLLAFPGIDRLDLDPASPGFGVPAGLPAPRTLDGKNAIAAMLEGHPRPFDRDETLRLVADVFRRLAGTDLAPPPGELDLPSLGIPQLEEVERIVPAGLRGGLLTGAPPSSAELVRAREALREVANPLGKYLAAATADLHGAALEKMAQDVTDTIALREVVLAVLGIRLHRIHAGEPPAALEALVAAGRLPRLPIDPWTGGPLRYRASDLAVWSVGADLTDDGGKLLPPGDESRPADIVRSAAWPGERR